MTSNQKGAIAELAIAKEAARLKVGVYLPVFEGGRCDLVLDAGTRLLRVQCKWGALVDQIIRVHFRTSRFSPTKGYVLTTYDATEVDAFGVYCGDLDECFLLPIHEFAGRNAVHLRVGPALNGQKQGLIWAKDYRFSGAIAQLGERRAGSAKAAGSSPASSTQLRLD